jgi:hypothetical protein
MSKKANPDPRPSVDGASPPSQVNGNVDRDDKPRIEKAVEKNEASDSDEKLSVHDKARQRKVELGKIIDYASRRLGEKVDGFTAEDLELKALIVKYTKPQKSHGDPTYSKRLREIIGSTGSQHEDDIWLVHRFGREPMLNLIKDAVLREKPALRYWVTFNEATGVYKVLGTGKMKPDGWTYSFLPRDQREESKPAIQSTPAVAEETTA